MAAIVTRPEAVVRLVFDKAPGREWAPSTGSNRKWCTGRRKHSEACWDHQRPTPFVLLGAADPGNTDYSAYALPLSPMATRVLHGQHLKEIQRLPSSLFDRRYCNRPD